jgi:hypothetical protein
MIMLQFCKEQILTYTVRGELILPYFKENSGLFIHLKIIYCIDNNGKMNKHHDSHTLRKYRL